MSSDTTIRHASTAEWNSEAFQGQEKKRHRGRRFASAKSNVFDHMREGANRIQASPYAAASPKAACQAFPFKWNCGEKYCHAVRASTM
ncbi:hypothetical protein AALD01_15325 [Oscillospiraceae bacterium 21-37]